MFAGKNLWPGIKSPDPEERLVSVQSTDSYQTYSVSAFKWKAGISASVSAYDVFGPGKS